MSEKAYYLISEDDIANLSKFDQTYFGTDKNHRDMGPLIRGKELTELLVKTKVTGDIALDAARFRKGIEDREFPKSHRGGYLHFSRKDGTMLTGDTIEECLDRTIEWDQMLHERMYGK